MVLGLAISQVSMSQSTKDFPNWETLYKSQRVETMPWYNENFDSDLKKELDERLLTIIINFLTLVPARQHKLYGLLKGALMLQALTCLKLQLTEQDKFMKKSGR
jgi:hypothetical protein